MLKIGEFSVLTSISIYMLRHYDEIGLLKPCFVDNDTGYRYYNEDQLLIASRIQTLKAMGFGLKEVSDALQSGTKTEDFKKLLENKATQKMDDIKKLQGQLQQIEKSLCEFEHKEEFTCCISVKNIPTRTVASCRAVIAEFSQEGILWGILMEECGKQNVQFVFPDYSLAIEHVVDLENSSIEVELQRSVDKLYQDTDRVKFFKVSEVTAASLTYRGGYNRIGEAVPYVAKWILENHYEICGPSFSIYHISPEQEENEENFITEVCFPIKGRT